MDIVLEHPAVEIITKQAWRELLGNDRRSGEICDTFGVFRNSINKIAGKITRTNEKIVNPYYRNPGLVKKGQESGLDVANKFKGDVFEIFCELLIKLSPLDDRIDIWDYHPAPVDEPGVDGYGKDKRELPVTVQTKYRRYDNLLKMDDGLGKFFTVSIGKYKVNKKLGTNLVAITAGAGIHWSASDLRFMTLVRCISSDASYGCIKGADKKTIDHFFGIRSLVDENKMFWDLFRLKVGL